jgi:DNA-binding MarR family transcriptional regulator
VQRNPLADEVWRAMAAAVIDNRDAWRRAVIEETRLPFSRIRILRRLDRQPMTVKQVAEAATIDAPAATVAVNDLENRGLVVRETDPTNRRCKVVSLTDAGREMVLVIDGIDDPAPDALASLDDAELKALLAIVDKIAKYHSRSLIARFGSRGFSLGERMLPWQCRAVRATPNCEMERDSATPADRPSPQRTLTPSTSK